MSEEKRTVTMILEESTAQKVNKMYEKMNIKNKTTIVALAIEKMYKDLYK